MMPALNLRFPLIVTVLPDFVTFSEPDTEALAVEMQPSPQNTHGNFISRVPSPDAETRTEPLTPDRFKRTFNEPLKLILTVPVAPTVRGPQSLGSNGSGQLYVNEFSYVNEPERLPVMLKTLPGRQTMSG